jgi:hypothetical protein
MAQGPAKAKKLLMGVGEIQQAFGWSRDQFVVFMILGLPARKINGRWYACFDNIDEFLRALLVRGKPIRVDVKRMPSEAFDG